MASVFTMIINGELPGRFVWRDDQCVAFLSIAPLTTGHLLVVPIAEVDHWLDLDPELAAHLTTVAQTLGRAQMEAFQPTKVALMIAGLEVPHVHLHVVPIDGVHDLDFANQRSDEPAEALDAAAEQIRTMLRSQGAPGVVDA